MVCFVNTYPLESDLSGGYSVIQLLNDQGLGYKVHNYVESRITLSLPVHAQKSQSQTVEFFHDQTEYISPS